MRCSPAQPGEGVRKAQYTDLNGDGKIDANDQTWLGTTLPTLEYGIRVELNYKNFDLSIFGSGVAGKTGFDPAKFMNSFIDTRNNYGPGVLNAWTPQNPGSNTPALVHFEPQWGRQNFDFYYVNASYFQAQQRAAVVIICRILWQSLLKWMA